jgi:hypothetical protein
LYTWQKNDDIRFPPFSDAAAFKVTLPSVTPASPLKLSVVLYGGTKLREAPVGFLPSVVKKIIVPGVSPVPFAQLIVTLSGEGTSGEGGNVDGDDGL